MGGAKSRKKSARKNWGTGKRKKLKTSTASSVVESIPSSQTKAIRSDSSDLNRIREPSAKEKNNEMDQGKNGLSIKRSELLKIIHTVAPTTSSVVKKLTANDVPIPRCSRKSRLPVSFEFSSSSDSEEDKAVQAMMTKVENDNSSQPTDKQVADTLETLVSKKTPIRKRRYRAKLTMKKGGRSRSRPVKTDKTQPDPSLPPQDFRLLSLPNTLSRNFSHGHKLSTDKMMEVKIILRRVEEDEKCHQLLQNFHSRTASDFSTVSSDDVDLDSYDCHICSQKFDDEQSLEKHLEEDHVDEYQTQKPMKCSHCSRFFTVRKMLEAHEALHAVKAKVNMIKDDFKSELKAKDKDFRCHICSKTFKFKQGLSNHLKTRHPKQCPKSVDVSGSSFQRRFKLRKKQEQHRRVKYPNSYEESEEEADEIYIAPEAVYISGVGSVKQEDVEMSEGDEPQLMITGVRSCADVNFPECDGGNPELQDPLMTLNCDAEMKSGGMKKSGNVFEISEGYQCDVSNLGSLLDLLEGPGPNSGVQCETLTLNYEDDMVGSFKCEYCSKVLTSKKLLQLHLKESHDARIRKPYICLHPNCSQRFESTQKLQIHRKTHLVKPDFLGAPLLTDAEQQNTNFEFESSPSTAAEEPVTSKEVSSGKTEEVILPTDRPTENGQITEQANLSTAVTIAERNEDMLKGYKYKCKLCGAKFKKLSIFVKHEWDHSENNTKSQCCPFCPRRFTDRSSYLFHVKAHSGSKAFGETKKSVMHLARNHCIKRGEKKSVSSRPVPCHHCHAVFNSVPVYISHINKAHADASGPRSRKYRCFYPNCNRPDFKHAWNFRVHVASHMTFPECSICGGKFATNFDLKKHKRIMHRSLNWTEIMFQTKLPDTVKKGDVVEFCVTCLKKVDNASEIHICPSLDQTEFSCELCDGEDVLYTREELQTHSQLHPKLPCRICSRRVFTARMDFHLESHLGETKYQCDVCRRPYVFQDSFKKHLLTRAHRLRAKRLEHNGRATEKEVGMNEAEETSNVYQNGDVGLQFEDTDEVVLPFHNHELEKNQVDVEADPLAQFPDKVRSSPDENQVLFKNPELIEENAKQTWLSSITMDSNSNSSQPVSMDSQFASEDSAQAYPSRPASTASSLGTGEIETCHFCQETCSGIFGLGNHMFRVHNLHFCATCHHCSRTIRDHEYHIDSSHGNSDLYCKACKKLFISKEFMNRHIEGDLHQLRVLQMENDSLSMDPGSSEDVEAGSSGKILLQPKGFACALCSKVFSIMHRLEGHLHQSHSLFLCTICHKFFGSRQELGNHRMGHVGESKYDCLICMLPFKSGASLNSHRRTKTHIERLSQVEKSSNESQAPVSFAVSEPLAADFDFQESNESAVFIVSDQSSLPKEMEPAQQKPLQVIVTPSGTGVLGSGGNASVLLLQIAGSYECCFCLKVFSEFHRFEEHSVVGHSMAFFKKEASRIKKLFRDVNQTPQIFRCTSCKNVFLDQTILSKHTDKFHPGQSLVLSQLLQQAAGAPLVLSQSLQQPTGAPLVLCQSLQQPGGVPLLLSQSLQQPAGAPLVLSQLLQQPAGPTRVTEKIIPEPSLLFPQGLGFPISFLRSADVQVQAGDAEIPSNNFYVCVNCDALFNSQVELNIHAVGCKEEAAKSVNAPNSSFCQTSSNTISTTAKAQPSTFNLTHLYQRMLNAAGSTTTPVPLKPKVLEVVDLTEEDDESNTNANSEAASPLNFGSPLHWNEAKKARMEEEEEAQPIIQSVYSIQDSAGFLNGIGGEVRNSFH